MKADRISKAAVLVAMIVGVAAAVGTIGWQWRATGRPPSLAGHLTASPVELSQILTEPRAIQRLHLLANWVDAHEPPEVSAAMQRVDGAARSELRSLLLAKLKKLHPGESAEEIQRRLAELHEAAPAGIGAGIQDSSTRDEVLALARTDPEAAIARLAALRLHPNEREELMCAVMGQVAETDPVRALRILAGRSDVSRPQALAAITRAWATQDPAAAYAWVRAQPASARRDWLWQVAVEEWANQDLAGAMEVALADETALRNGANAVVARKLISRWLAESPGESAAWIRNQPSPSPLVVRAAVEAFAQSHPQLAADLFVGRMNFEEQRRCVSLLVEGWMQADAQGCLAWLRSRPADAVFFAAARLAAARLAGRDPAAAMAFVGSLPRDAYVGEVLAAVADGMKSPAAAFDWLVTLSDSTAVDHALIYTLQRMELAHPQDALVLLSRVPAGPKQRAVYAAVAKSWMLRDPAGAVGWLRTLNDPAVLLAAVRAVRWEWSESDPAGAAAFATGLGSGPAFDSLVPQVARRWASLDPLSAAKWVLSLGESAAAVDATSPVFTELARYHPGEVRQLLATVPAGGKRREAAFSGIMDIMSRSDPEGAAQLLVEHGTTAEQKRFARGVASGWSKLNPERAAQWVTSLPATGLRDQALQGLLSEMVKASPERALSFAHLASTPSAKDNVIATVLYAWRRQDAAAAQAALEHAGLSENRRKKLQSEFAR